MKTKIKALIVILLFSNNLMSQIDSLYNLYDCGTVSEFFDEDDRSANCSNSSDTYLNKFRKPFYWIPDYYHFTPIKTLKVNFVVFQKDDGTGTLIDDPYTRSQFQVLVDSLNYRFSNSQVKGYPSTCESDIFHTVDTKIRIHLNDVIFIPNSNVYNGIGHTSAALTTVHNLVPESKECFNIILINNLSYAWGEYVPNAVPGHDAIRSGGHHNAAGLNYFLRVGHFMHEIAHGLGLHHTYGSERNNVNHFDFLEDIFGKCSEPLMSDPLNPCFDCPTVSCPCNPLPDQVCYLTAPCFFNNFEGANPLMSGMAPNLYVSSLQAGRFHRALSMYENTYVVNNRNMHKYVMEKHPYLASFYVNDDQHWDFSIKMYQNIEVLPGNTLTITCNVLMPLEGKIIVHPGAKLIVNGGRISCAHDGTWQGIQVYGNSNLSQTSSNQGEVVLMNDAIIEHAEVGIDVWRPGNWSTTGGIVRATNSTFKNNKKDVQFMYYENIQPSGAHIGNKSYFTNVEFYWDDELRVVNPVEHVSMYHVDGISFNGCLFTDYRIDQPKTGVGIKSHDAKYTVQARCTAPVFGGCTGNIDDVGTSWDPTLFENLYFGIWANNSNNTYTINVDRCIFRDNGYGVHTIGVSSPVIIRNIFEFTDNPDHFHVGTAMCGIHLQNTKGVKVEENIFRDLSPGTTNTYGVACTRLGENDEQIYKNTFTGLSQAVWVQGLNRSTTTTYIGEEGLHFPCNTNTNNRQDHLVLPTHWGVYPTPSNLNGVKYTTGTLDKPTGTTFTENMLSLEDYNNETFNVIKYFHHTTQAPIEHNINAISTTFLNTCPSHLSDKYPNGFIKLTEDDKLAYLSGFYDTDVEIEQKETIYQDKLIDEIEHQTIMDAIANLSPNNKQSLKNLLDLHSPYLTTDILFAVADNPPSDSPHPWVRDYLLANIEAVTSELIDFLSIKAYPLPQTMINEIINAKNNTYTQRLVLESEISDLYARRSFYGNHLLLDIQHDTIMGSTDSLRNWLQEINHLLHQNQIIDSYLQDRNFTQAETEINNLESLVQFYPPHIQKEITDFVALKKFLILILAEPGKIAQLNASELRFLRIMAADGVGIANIQAENILCFFYDECPEERLLFGNNNSNRQIGNEDEVYDNEKALFMIEFAVYPNPANDKMIIVIPNDVFSELSNTELIITDLSGKVIHQTILNSESYTWETNQVDNGIYLIKIQAQNKTLKTKKVVIQH